MNGMLIDYPRLRGDIENKTKNPAVARIADRTGCQWPVRSSKVNDFHFIWKGDSHFLLVINSNHGRISHRFRVMASFPSNFLFLPFHPNFENVFLALDRWNFACSSFTHIANYSCKTFFPTPYLLATIHPLQTERQTDGRQTDDNHINSSTAT